MITAEILDTVAKGLTPSQRQQIMNQTLDNYTLKLLMDSCVTPFAVLRVLVVELQGRHRPSFVSRIYGRYRKMLPKSDLEEMQAWVKQNRL